MCLPRQKQNENDAEALAEPRTVASRWGWSRAWALGPAARPARGCSAGLSEPSWCRALPLCFQNFGSSREDR